MAWKQILVLIINFILYIKAYEVPFSSLCKIEDSKCITKMSKEFVPTFVAGIPEIGVEKLDPLFIDYVDASTPELKMETSNLTIVGFKNTEIQQIKIDKSITSLMLKLLVGLEVDGQYQISGKLFLLPIEGKGPLHIKIRKVEVTVNVNIFEKTSNNGRKYWFSEYKDHEVLLKDKADIEFGNLFMGNEILAKAVKELIAQNGAEVIYAVSPSIIRAVANKIIVRINELLNEFDSNKLYLH